VQKSVENDQEPAHQKSLACSLFGPAVALSDISLLRIDTAGCSGSNKIG